MAVERRRVVYAGHVQGVGFRYTARWLAAGHEVAGYVRNLHDGRVELVAEGEPEALDGYLEAVGAEMAGCIRSADIQVVPPGDPPFEGFVVRH